MVGLLGVQGAITPSSSAKLLDSLRKTVTDKQIRFSLAPDNALHEVQPLSIRHDPDDLRECAVFLVPMAECPDVALHLGRQLRPVLRAPVHFEEVAIRARGRLDA